MARGPFPVKSLASDPLVSDSARSDAQWAVSLAFSLRDAGWIPHQHPTNVIRFEEESIPWPGVIPLPLQSRLSTLSSRLSQAFAFLPPPELRSISSSPVPSSSRGIRLPLPRGVPFSPERTFSRSNPTSATPMWKGLVAELAAGWAILQDPVSFGLVFLGPRERLCYWPKWLNSFLLDIPVSYGRVWDLFSLLAAMGLKVDLKAAFRSIRVDPEDVPLLGALVDSIPICFSRLPFGLKTSPAIFVGVLSSTMRSIGSSLPSTSTALSSFVDDISSSSTDIASFVLAAERIVNALIHDGWWVSLAKCFLYPTSRLLYVGFICDFKSQGVRIAPSKLQKVIVLLGSISIPLDSVTLPLSQSSGLLSSRSLRIGASTPGISVLAFNDDVDLSVFPRPPALCLAIRDSPSPQSSWPSHSPCASVDAVCSLLEAWISSVPRLPSPPIVSIISFPDEVPDLISSLPPTVSTTCAVVISSMRPRHPPTRGSSWLLRALADLSPRSRDLILSRIPTLPNIPLPPLTRSASPSLDPVSWFALRKLLGTIAWLQSVFPWLGFIRAPLDHVLTSSSWSPLGVSSILAVREIIPMLGAASASAHRPPNPTVVVVDSSRVSWGAVIPRSPPIFVTGAIRSSMWSAPSTGREACGARSAAVYTIELPGPPVSAFSIVVDSTALVGSSLSGSSSDETNETMSFFAALHLAGIPSSFLWERRSEGLHPMTDALSGDRSNPWPLLHEMYDLIRERAGHWSASIGSSAGRDGAVRFASLNCGREARDAILSGVSPSGGIGWIGSISSAPLHPSDVLFCVPLWSQLGDLWRVWEARRFNMILVAPVTPATWWAPFLANFQIAAMSSFPLPLRSQDPPVQDRDLFAPDPRPLAVYSLSSRSPYGSTSRGGAVAFAQSMPNARNPGPIIASRSSSAPTPLRRTVPPVPVPIPSPQRSSRSSRPSIIGSGQSHASPHPTLRSRPSVRHTAVTVPQVPVSIPSPQRARRSSLPRVHGRPPTPMTLGRWLQIILADAAGLRATSVPLGVAPVHGSALASAARTIATKVASGSSRTVRIAERMRDFVRHLAIEDHPWSLSEVDALATHYATARISKSPPCGWPKPPTASCIRSELSSLAEASRRSGFDVPKNCGPQAGAFTAAKGGKAKKDHSTAFPIALGAIIAARPPASSPLVNAWKAMVIMSSFCLRTGIVFWLHYEMFVPYDGGYIFVWRHSQKRTACVDDAEAVSSIIGSISAARHPILLEIIGSSRTGRMFPGLSAENLTSFILPLLPDQAPGFSFRSYGSRVSADQDATALCLPDDICATMFWWKRVGGLLMRSYYAGINILACFIFTERRSLLRYNNILPGRCDVSVPVASAKRWKDIDVRRVLPPLPQMRALRGALECVSWSYVTARRLRAKRNTDRARVAAGFESDSLASVTSQSEGRCCLCESVIQAEDDSAACIRCSELVCMTCHPDLALDFRCPAHRVAKRSRSTKST